MSVGVPSLLGYLDPAAAFLFPDGPRGLPRNTGPRSLALPGSSSPELRLLSRVYCHLQPARRPQPPGAFPEVSRLFRDISPRSPLPGRYPVSCLRSALSVSHALDGLLLLEPRELVSSHSRV
jgi:hypothetical protein